MFLHTSLSHYTTHLMEKCKYTNSPVFMYKYLSNLWNRLFKAPCLYGCSYISYVSGGTGLLQSHRSSCISWEQSDSFSTHQLLQQLRKDRASSPGGSHTKFGQWRFKLKSREERAAKCLTAPYQWPWSVTPSLRCARLQPSKDPAEPIFSAACAGGSRWMEKLMLLSVEC